MASNFTRNYTDYIQSAVFANSQFLDMALAANPVGGPNGNQEISVRIADPSAVETVSQGSFSDGGFRNTFTALNFDGHKVSEAFDVTEYNGEEAAFAQAASEDQAGAFAQGLVARAEHDLIEDLQGGSYSGANSITLSTAGDPSISEIYSAVGTINDNYGGQITPEDYHVVLHPAAYMDFLENLTVNVRNTEMADSSITTINGLFSVQNVTATYRGSSSTNTADANSKQWVYDTTNAGDVCGYVFHRNALAYTSTGVQASWQFESDAHWYAVATHGFGHGLLDADKVVELANA